MKTVMRDGPTAIAASVFGTIAPTVRPIAEAAKDSTVIIPQNFPNLARNLFVRDIAVKYISHLESLVGKIHRGWRISEMQGKAYA